MERISHFKTIDELEKAIIDKSVELDIIYSTGRSLIHSFDRLIRTAYIWFCIASLVYTTIKYNPITLLKVIGLELIIYIICALLSSWVKFNYDNEYRTVKENLLSNLMYLCEEYKNYDKNSWEAKQMYKRMMNLGGLDVSFENNQE